MITSRRHFWTWERLLTVIALFAASLPTILVRTAITFTFSAGLAGGILGGFLAVTRSRWRGRGGSFLTPILAGLFLGTVWCTVIGFCLLLADDVLNGWGSELKTGWIVQHASAGFFYGLIGSAVWAAVLKTVRRPTGPEIDIIE